MGYCIEVDDVTYASWEEYEALTGKPRPREAWDFFELRTIVDRNDWGRFMRWAQENRFADAPMAFRRLLDTATARDRQIEFWDRLAEAIKNGEW